MAFTLTTLAVASPSVVGKEGVSRLALVIANARYAREDDRLNGPPLSAKLVADALRARGFIAAQGVPFVLTDATRDQLRKAIIGFNRALRQAGPQAIGFIYYAGH